MDKIVIQGGVPLRGSIQVSGSKNAALPILCAGLLGEGPSTVRNVPELADVGTMARLLRALGSTVELGSGKDKHIVTVAPPSSRDVVPEAPYEMVKTMRAAVLVLGPLVARFGRARVSLPGGCAIGARPIDQHLKGLAKLGAEIKLSHGYVEAECKRLKGATVLFDLQTVTGTENLMMAAALARGRTVLENAAREPEVEELANVLGKMGAQIAGAGTDVITIEGVESLKAFDHHVVADRIEAGTFLVAAAITHGDVRVEGAVPEHLEVLIQKLRDAGATVTAEPGAVRVKGPARPHAIDLKTQPYPGFPTDMQAQTMVLCAVARGTSVVTETVFENRFMHVQELIRMGANIRIDGHTAVVEGASKLSGAPVMATDLRASACLVLAGLRAEDTTEVHRVYHLDRGYEHIERKLRGLGAQIRRAKA